MKSIKIELFFSKNLYFTYKPLYLKKKMSLTRFEEWLDSAGLKHELHQKQAVEWCLKREQALEHQGGIIADEMGLGDDRSEAERELLKALQSNR